MPHLSGTEDEALEWRQDLPNLQQVSVSTFICLPEVEEQRGPGSPFAPCAGAPGLPSSLDMQSPGGRARGQRAVLRCDSLSLSEPGLQRRKARASSPPVSPLSPRPGTAGSSRAGRGLGLGTRPRPESPRPRPESLRPAPPARGAGKSRSGGGSGTCCGRICAWARRSCGGRWAGARLGVPPAGRGAGGRPVHGGRCAARVPAQVAQGGEPEAGMPARRRKGPCHRRAKGRGGDRVFPKGFERRSRGRRRRRVSHLNQARFALVLRAAGEPRARAEGQVPPSSVPSVSGEGSVVCTEVLKRWEGGPGQAQDPEKQTGPRASRGRRQSLGDGCAG